MAELTIGGQAYAVGLPARAVAEAEARWTKHGGRPLLEILAAANGGGVFFKLAELEGFCWGAWHRTLGDARPDELLAQYYAEGGTVWELHATIVEALIDGGLLGRRAPPVDPPAAG